MRHRDFSGPLHGLRDSMNGRYPKIGDRVRCQDMCNGRYYSGVVDRHALNSHYNFPIYVVSVDVADGVQLAPSGKVELHTTPPEFMEILKAAPEEIEDASL